MKSKKDGLNLCWNGRIATIPGQAYKAAMVIQAPALSDE